MKYVKELLVIVILLGIFAQFIAGVIGPYLLWGIGSLVAIAVVGRLYLRARR